MRFQGNGRSKPQKDYNPQIENHFSRYTQVRRHPGDTRRRTHTTQAASSYTSWHPIYVANWESPYMSWVHLLSVSDKSANSVPLSRIFSCSTKSSSSVPLGWPLYSRLLPSTSLLKLKAVWHGRKSLLASSFTTIQRKREHFNSQLLPAFLFCPWIVVTACHLTQSLSPFKYSFQNHFSANNWRRMRMTKRK